MTNANVIYDLISLRAHEVSEEGNVEYIQLRECGS